MRKLFLISLVFLALTAGCAGSGLHVAGREEALEDNKIYDSRTGRELTLDELARAVSASRVVFIGEQHNHQAQHRHQLELLRALHGLDPRLALGLEVFSRPDQKLLDSWGQGELAEREFSRRVTDGILNLETLDVYFPILYFARREKIPILALNAPRSITGKIAREGLQALSPEERASIPGELVMGPDEYRERVAQAFSGHAGHVDLDRFFAAQVAWDETMAQTLADYLASPAGRDRRVVVICGNEHVFRRHGLPSRLARRVGVSQVVLLGLVSTESETLGPREADFAWVTAPEAPVKRPRLGVALEKDLTVSSVTAGSEAERIGLRTGDRLLELDGSELEGAMDLHRIAIKGGAGAEHYLVVERGGLRLGFKFSFK
ncbi:MAG: ChaN family lipoprotein [Pseudomonadota bacterium]